MPDRKERDAWWKFIAGNPESDWNIPKKPKVNRRQRYGRIISHKNDSDEERYEVWHVRNDEELEPSNDASDTLPTPIATPAPSEVAMSEGMGESLQHAQQDFNSQPVPEKQRQRHREPTPSLITHIDHVCPIEPRLRVAYLCQFSRGHPYIF